jgi:4'-phosphopantetheinyl transferase
VRLTGVPAPTTCEIWWATPTGARATYALLDRVEQKRAASLRAAGDRDRYATAHALVRLVLAARTGVPPTSLELAPSCRRCGGAHGKPRLVHPRVDVRFNLAHAPGRVVVAVAESREVGVDVEPVPVEGDPTVPALAAEALAPAELTAYHRLPPSQRNRAVAVWWTRKEAVLKASGDGLAVPPSSVVVRGPEPVTPRALLGGPARATSVRDLHPGRGYVGSVAVLDAPSLAVTEHDADPLLQGR